MCAESRSVSDRAIANNEEETKHRGRNRRQENAPAATWVRRSVIRLSALRAALDALGAGANGLHRLDAQVAVDGAHQLVVATEVTANASDQGGVPALLDALAETGGEQPETVLADAGYSNERDLADLETRGIDGCVSLGREGKAARPRDPEKYPATSRMAEKLSRPAGRAAYAERKWLSEAPNGWITHVLGFRRFSLRGLAKVQGEWDLVCRALNTKRLHALMAA